MWSAVQGDGHRLSVITRRELLSQNKKGVEQRIVQEVKGGESTRR